MRGEIKVWWIAAALMQIAPSATVLEPSGKWTVDAASRGCDATRPFNDGQAQLSVASPLLARRLVISANLALPTKIKKDATLAIVVGPGGRRFEGKSLEFVPSGISSREFGISVDSEEFVIQDIAEVSFEYNQKVLSTFKTGSWIALNKAIDACSRELLSSFGIDLERERQVVTPAVPKLAGQLILASKISDDAHAQRLQGQLGLRVRVGTDGRIEQCTPVTSSGSSTIDERACNLLVEKGRYIPARDRANMAMISEQLIFLRWLPVS